MESFLRSFSVVCGFLGSIASGCRFIEASVLASGSGASVTSHSHAHCTSHQNPDHSQHDGDASENVASSRSKRALSAHPTESAGQPAAATALNQHEKDHRQADDYKQGGKKIDYE
jgi:hypothetical protein